MFKGQEMLIVFICFSCSTFLISGSSQSSKVLQNPADIYKYPNESKAEIHCSHYDNTFTRILWYKQSASKDLQFLGYLYGGSGSPEKDVNVAINGKATQGETCTLTVEGLDQNSSAVYFCAANRANYEAYFGQGTKLTVLEKNITVTPPTVKILEPSNKECKDKKGKKKKTLVCVASGFYPDHVSVFWTRDGMYITDGVSTDAAAKRDGDYYKITSRLIVPIRIWIKPNVEFKCIVSFFDGTSNIETSNTFTTKGIDNPGMTRENYIKISQNAKLSYSVLIVKSCLYAALVCFLVWKLQGKRVKQTK